ncbi:MAG: translation elongation factor Ts [Verrucomicrobiae bacterium]|nr:translation elongation factor Ts [Verrucomicrobiae bacterium]
MSTVIDAKTVQQLREKTNAGMMDCKKALLEAKGNLEEAETILRKRGITVASKKAGRAASEGAIASYIHMGGKMGVLVEVNCETDFVAKTDAFKELVKDITLQIAATRPLCVSRDQVPAGLVEKEREIARAQIKDKPEPVVEKIVGGKIEKYYSTVCLMEQAFIKDPNKTIKEILTARIAELGENLIIRRFSVFQLGEEIAGDASSEAGANGQS